MDIIVGIISIPHILMHNNLERFKKGLNDLLTEMEGQISRDRRVIEIGIAMILFGLTVACSPQEANSATHIEVFSGAQNTPNLQATVNALETLQAKSGGISPETGLSEGEVIKPTEPPEPTLVPTKTKEPTPKTQPTKTEKPMVGFMVEYGFDPKEITAAQLKTAQAYKEVLEKGENPIYRYGDKGVLPLNIIAIRAKTNQEKGGKYNVNIVEDSIGEKLVVVENEERVLVPFCDDKNELTGFLSVSKKLFQKNEDGVSDLNMAYTVVDRNDNPLVTEIAKRGGKLLPKPSMPLYTVAGVNNGVTELMVFASEKGDILTLNPLMYQIVQLRNELEWTHGTSTMLIDFPISAYRDLRNISQTGWNEGVDKLRDRMEGLTEAQKDKIIKNFKDIYQLYVDGKIKNKDMLVGCYWWIFSRRWLDYANYAKY